MTTIVLLAKEPVPGRVKTRLHARFSAQQAARLATAAIADTAAAIRSLDVRAVIAYDGRPGGWLPAGFRPLAQSTGDLSRRIECALRDAAHADEPVLLVGMDTPQLGTTLARAVAEAEAGAEAAAEAGADAVVGLTEDGGYWLIGLRRYLAGAVEGVPMSTGGTGAAQVARLRSLGLGVRLLPGLRDVDTPADAAAVATAYPELRFSRVHRRLVTTAVDAVSNDRGVFDAALAGRHGGVAYVDPSSGGAPVALDHDRWQRPADAVDRLVIGRCRGPALDIGCGPGRFVRALSESGVAALGVDSSVVAVGLTAGQGAAVLHRAVQAPLPGEGRWQTVLLMDGNIGIGGDVGSLLRRCRELVHRDGTVVVEVDADPDIDTSTTLAVFDDAGGWSGSVPWARTGAVACAAYAGAAGLDVAEEWSASGRAFLALRPRPVAW